MNDSDLKLILMCLSDDQMDNMLFEFQANNQMEILKYLL